MQTKHLLTPAFALACCLSSATLHAQTDLRGWHVDGQTWLVWTDDLALTGKETYSVYRSPNPIVDLAQAELVGRLYDKDWSAARVRIANDGAEWVLPDASGHGTYTLTPDEATFVYTPHDPVDEYFAVVRSGNGALSADNTTGAIGPAGVLDRVRPQPQFAGVNAGHPFTVYAIWLDGRADPDDSRPDFPVMGNEHFNGTAQLFCVFEPRSPRPRHMTSLGDEREPVPAVLAMHGGAGSYWQWRPSNGDKLRIDLHVDEGLYVTLDDQFFMADGAHVFGQQSRWFGYWEGFDRFDDDPHALPPDDGIIRDYTQQRLAWIIDWLVAVRGVDAARVSMMGLSNGARGTNTFARVYPERIAAGMCFALDAVFAGTPFEALFGDPSQDLATNLPGAVGITTFFYPGTRVSAEDVPFLRHVNGTNDSSQGWASKLPLFYQLDEEGWGWQLYWDCREHVGGEGGWDGCHWTGSPRHDARWLTRHRSDQSFPAFHRVDHDLAQVGQQPFPDDPPQDPWGTWGGFFDWELDTIVDEADGWGATLFMISSCRFAGDVPPLPTAKASVTLRRLQSFAPRPHEVLYWSLHETAGGDLRAEGVLQANEDGLVTVPDLPFDFQRLRLRVQRVGELGELVHYGHATPGCAGDPTIEASSSPTIGNAGFALLAGNAPPSASGYVGVSPSADQRHAFGVTVYYRSSDGWIGNATSDANGDAVVPLPIADDPALVGSTFHAQFLWTDPCGPQGVSASDGLAITIQP